MDGREGGREEKELGSICGGGGEEGGAGERTVYIGVSATPSSVHSQPHYNQQ